VPCTQHCLLSSGWQPADLGLCCLFHFVGMNQVRHARCPTMYMPCDNPTPPVSCCPIAHKPCAPQVVTQTQSGPALVIDLTASPFYEPGPLPQCLAALLGLAVTPQEDPAAAAAAAAEAAPAVAAAAGSNALAVSALSLLPAGEWKRAEQLTKGLKVRHHNPPVARHLCLLSHSVTACKSSGLGQRLAQLSCLCHTCSVNPIQ
jgi:hypothetical protein